MRFTSTRSWARTFPHGPRRVGVLAEPPCSLLDVVQQGMPRGNDAHGASLPPVQPEWRRGQLGWPEPQDPALVRWVGEAPPPYSLGYLTLFARMGSGSRS